MAIREISSYHLGDMLLVFEEETEFHRVGFYMIPWSMQKDRVLDRKFYRINSLAQVKIAGDMYPNCYGNGQTMRNGESANRMDYKSQKEVATECGKEIHTYFEDARGYELENVITYYHGEDSFEMKNILPTRQRKKSAWKCFPVLRWETFLRFWKELAPMHCWYTDCAASGAMRVVW